MEISGVQRPVSAIPKRQLHIETASHPRQVRRFPDTPTRRAPPLRHQSLQSPRERFKSFLTPRNQQKKESDNRGRHRQGASDHGTRAGRNANQGAAPRAGFSVVKLLMSRC